MLIRISGVNIDGSKHMSIALTAIFGINRSTAIKICQQCNMALSTKLDNLDDESIELIRNCIKQYTIEGDLRRVITNSIRRLVDINCYRGKRRIAGLPVRGQRTRSNAKTCRRLKKLGLLNK